MGESILSYVIPTKLARDPSLGLLLCGPLLDKASELRFQLERAGQSPPYISASSAYAACSFSLGSKVRAIWPAMAADASAKL